MSDERIYLDVAVGAARKAGRIILENLGKLSKDDVGLKQASDFVTRVDKESERTIIGEIREAFPNHDILSEETHPEPEDSGLRWIIDPLDGTTNYIHGYPMFSVSIALEIDTQMVTGVVFDPLREELFTTEKGGGAWLNSTRLSVSAFSSMADSLLTTGFPFRKKEMLDLYLKAFSRVFRRVSGIRRAGSAALDLAHLAAGRCDGFFELFLSPWDIAAGSLLVREAGGFITDFGGGEDYLSTGNVLAGNAVVHGELLKEIKYVFGGIVER